MQSHNRQFCEVVPSSSLWVNVTRKYNNIKGNQQKRDDHRENYELWR